MKRISASTKKFLKEFAIVAAIWTAFLWLVVEVIAPVAGIE